MLCYRHTGFVTVMLQLLGDTDKALSILRARSLLVRLIQSLPTPAIAAAGGPSGLLNITRLLAAQELAKGKAPASFGTTCRGGGSDADQSSETSVAGDQQAEPVDPKSNSKLGPERDGKLVDSPSSDQDSLLKVITVGTISECVRSLGRRCRMLIRTNNRLFIFKKEDMVVKSPYTNISLDVHVFTNPLIPRDIPTSGLTLGTRRRCCGGRSWIHPGSGYRARNKDLEALFWAKCLLRRCWNRSTR